MDEKNQGSSLRRHARTIVIILVTVLLYAYAVQVTQINLEEPLEPRRQENVVDLLRQLARPDLFTYDVERRSTNISIRMPCPEEVRGSQVTIEDRVLVLAPNCANTTQDVLQLRGEGFAPRIQGVVRWYAPGATTTRQITSFRTNSEGAFDVAFTMPDIRETEEPQRLEVVEALSRQISGFSAASRITFDRIVETILMALMASTIGTILAVPISFIAARNLMVNTNAPLAAVAGAIAAIPVGGWLGNQVATRVVIVAEQVSNQLMIGVGAFVLAAVLTWPILRLGPPLGQEGKSPGLWALSAVRILVAILLALFSLGVLAHLGLVAGDWLQERLGFFGFLGNFVFVLSDFMRLTLPMLTAFVGGLVAASYGHRYGQEAVLRLKGAAARLLTAAVTALGTVVLIYGVGSLLNWLYTFDNPQNWTLIPAVIGGSVAGVLALLVAPKRPFPIGFAIYTLTRGTLNILRSIEPIILGIIFVVWVGIGPFAGILALTLHSIADLGKLFSEQVENIDEGPLEAVTATGANRLQTITFAVIPQIVPHYIAFIFYRWDINVRMSTIIGFVGGGGIGLVLQRSANLTQYRQASVMVIAIAVTVTTLDYISSQIRSRII